MKPAELRMHIRNTKWFIEQNPAEVVLNRGTQTKTASGGKKDGSTPLDQAQTFRIIEPGSATSPQFITGADGRQRSVEFWLLGMPDADVKIDDWWIDEDGREVEVGDIVRSNGYETRAIITQRGKGS